MPDQVGTLGLVVIPIMVVSMIGSYAETAGLVARGSFSEEARCTASLALRLGTAFLSLPVLAFFFSPFSHALLRSDANVTLSQQLAPVLCLLPFVEAFLGYFLLWLQRKLLIARAAALQGVQATLFGILGSAALLAGLGATGIAIAQLLSATCAAVTAWMTVSAGNSPRFQFEPSAVRAILREGVRQTAGGLGGFLAERTDNLLLAARLGPGAMSVYSLAWTGSRVPIGIVSRIGRSILLPRMVRAADPAEVWAAAEQALSRGFAFSGLAALLASTSGEALTVLILGERWRQAGQCLALMSGTILVAPLLFVGIALVQQAGRSHLLALASGLQVALQFTLIPFLADTWGPRGVAVLDVLSTSSAIAVVLSIGGYGVRAAAACGRHLLPPVAIAGIGALLVLPLPVSWVAEAILISAVYAVGIWSWLRRPGALAT